MLKNTCLIALLIICVFIHLSCLNPSHGLNKRPSELEKPGIIIGADFLMKKTFFLTEDRFYHVTDIVEGELDSKPGEEIGIAGGTAIYFVDRNGTIISQVVIRATSAIINFIDVDSDSITEYMARGSWAINAGLYSHQGEMQWDTSEYLHAVDDMDMGDVDGNGVPEFVIGFNGGGGVLLIDKDGNKIWQQPDGNVWHVEMVDTNGDGKDEIVHSNAGGKITIRDENGDIISQKKLEPYLYSFSIVHWPFKSDKKYVLLAENDFIWLIDFDGMIAKKYRGPNCGKYGDAKGTPVRFIKNQPEFFAVVVQFRPWKRSILYIYDSEDELVYHEILDEECGAIAALPLKEDGADVLLVGGEKNVWRYEIK